MDNDKEPHVSLGKIVTAIVGLIVLCNLKKIFQFIEPLFEWYQESLDGLYDFPRGAQTAIAFLSIVLVVVLVVKHFRKE